LKSSTAYETLDRSVLRPRLLLGLNGIGTNAGFQRMAGLQSGTTAKDLAYVRRRYITVETPGLVVRELGGYWRAASLARMTVCRLVPYRFASADTLAPAAICSCTAAR
jgi:Tn3 transposase DDE domain